MYYRQPRSPSQEDQQIIEQITHLAGVAIERRQTQDALSRSEAYLAEAQRLTHTGSWAWDSRTNEGLYWSDEMFRIFELDPQQGPPPAKMFWELVHPDDRESMQELVRNAVQAKSSFEHDHRILLPDGTVKHIHAIGHPLIDGTGVEYVGTSIDVTERKRAEAERERLRRLEENLARINRVSMLGELTASLGHEIKQPIAAAVSNAEACLQWLARDQLDTVEVREAATEMVREARRAAEIMTRIRALFKKEEIKREVLDLNEVITDTVSLIREEAGRSSIQVHTELAPEHPWVWADRVQLQQVLTNLMLNGLEAMKGAGGELIIRSQQDQEGPLLISVSDAGMGLPLGDRDKIFDAFFTTKPQGTGMGLAISRSIVESHGGRLWASANPGPGTTFYFTLPNEVAEGA
jgi:signal transduction histidine kinase